jgi:2-phosphosulfolactate phosphatase
MRLKIDVALVPPVPVEHDENTLCTVIDVLRATTTIVTALASGAAEVRPFPRAADARKASRTLARQSWLLGGEEEGRRVPGFDLGNSPDEYRDPSTVGRKTILFATTNGTPALFRAFSLTTRPVCVAALVNLSAASAVVTEAALQLAAERTEPGPDLGSRLSRSSPVFGREPIRQETRILLVCAGRKGDVAAEDVFCAGAMAKLIADFASCSAPVVTMGDSALVAAAFASTNARKAVQVLRSSAHGRYLRELGFEGDLEFASQTDLYRQVPLYDGVRIAIQPTD